MQASRRVCERQPVLAHLRAPGAAPGKMPQSTELSPEKRSMGLLWAQCEGIYFLKLIN